MEPKGFSTVAGFLLGTVSVLLGVAVVICQALAIAIYNGSLTDAYNRITIGTTIQPGIWAGVVYIFLGLGAIVAGWAQRGNVIRAVNVFAYLALVINIAAIIITAIFVYCLDTMNRNTLTFNTAQSSIKFNNATEVFWALVGLYGAMLGLLCVLFLFNLVLIYVTAAYLHYIYKYNKYHRYFDRKDSYRSRDRSRAPSPIYGQVYSTLPKQVLPVQLARPQVYDPYSIYYTYPAYNPSPAPVKAITLPSLTY